MDGAADSEHPLCRDVGGCSYRSPSPTLRFARYSPSLCSHSALGECCSLPPTEHPSHWVMGTMRSGEEAALSLPSFKIADVWQECRDGWSWEMAGALQRWAAEDEMSAL